MNFLQKKRIIIVLLLYVLIGLIVYWGTFLSKINAKEFVYNQSYLPPRIQTICMNGYIGYEYNPNLEKRCRSLWNIWTNEILTTINE